MNKKQKIIILLLSLFCGIPIIFFTFRDNQNQKNNLSLKKEENNQDNEENHQQSASFFFWIIILVILIIIFWIFYQSCLDYIDDSESEMQPNPTEPRNNLLIKKKFYLVYLEQINYQIVFAGDNYRCVQKEYIDKALKFDTDELSKLMKKPFSEQEQKTLKEIFQAMADFLTTYLTGLLFKDVYQDYQNSKISYEILTEMAKTLIKKQNDCVSFLYCESLTTAKKDEYPETDHDNIQKITNGDMMGLLKSILKRSGVTIFYSKEVANEKIYLFRNFFIFHRLVNKIYQNLVIFMEKHDQYEKILKNMNDQKTKLDQLIS